MSRHKLLLLFVPLLFVWVLQRDTRIQVSIRLLADADRLAMLYNWSKAAPLYTQAELLFDEAGDKKNALHARLGHLWATANAGITPEIVQEVSGYLQNPLVTTDLSLMLRALVAKAALDSNSNEIAARPTWERILNLARTVRNKDWEARAMAEVGQIRYMDGDVKAATDMFRQATISQYLRFDFGAAFHYTAMVGNGLVEAGRPETGLQYCNTILRLTSLVKDLGFPFLAYQGKARALFALDRTAEAKIVLDEAITRARNEGDYMALSQLLVVAGTGAANSAPSEAIGYLSEANRLSGQKGFNHVFAWSTWGLAKVYREMGDIDRAEPLASKSVEMMRLLEDRYHLPEHLTLLASLKTKKGDVQAADQLYSEATDVIEGLLVNLHTGQLKASLIATLSEAYTGHFELAATAFNDSVKAYEIIEQARGRALADRLRGESESLAFADPVTVQAQKEISQIQLALLHETNRDARQPLLDKLFAQEQLLSPARNTDPHLRLAEHARPVSAKVLQASLGSDELLIQYVLGETQSYCVRIDRTRVDIVVLPVSKKRVEDLVQSYLDTTRSKRIDVGVEKQLFSVLLQPVLAKRPRGRLIIVPDGQLHLLPFDALRQDDGRYLLDSHVVTYAPSASVLYLLRRRSYNHATLNVLGVGDVPYSGLFTANMAGSSALPKGEEPSDLFDEGVESLPNLPGSREEVLTVADVMKGNNRVLLGSYATEGQFKALSLRDYQVIHLAVHGVANLAFPDRAALILGHSPDLNEDGLLQAREIRELSLRAELVTLSACDTGNGRLLGVEGISSLENAFLMAGAKTVVASLWTADDTYTLALMKRFYQRLAEGLDTGSAVQRAKADFLEQFGNQTPPIYWAGFKVIGDAATRIVD